MEHLARSPVAGEIAWKTGIPCPVSHGRTQVEILQTPDSSVSPGISLAMPTHGPAVPDVSNIGIDPFHTAGPSSVIKRKTFEPPPGQWRKEVERVLITEEQIARRVRQLTRRLETDFAGRDLVIVSLLNGTVLFLADLIRHLSLPLRLDFIGVSSYGANTVPGQLVFTKELRIDVRGRDVLLVDDILDTGKTLKRVLTKLRALKPRRVRVCVLLEKRARRVAKIRVDYVGFRIPDLFVVGCGLDFAERYRNLSFVGVLRPQYRQGS